MTGIPMEPPNGRVVKRMLRIVRASLVTVRARRETNKIVMPATRDHFTSAVCPLPPILSASKNQKVESVRRKTSETQNAYKTQNMNGSHLHVRREQIEGSSRTPKLSIMLPMKKP